MIAHAPFGVAAMQFDSTTSIKERSQLKAIKGIWFPLHSGWFRLGMWNKLVQLEWSPGFLFKERLGKDKLFHTVDVWYADVMPRAAAAILLSWVEAFEKNPTKHGNTTEGISDEWNQNSNQSITSSELFHYLPVHYSLSSQGRAVR